MLSKQKLIIGVSVVVIAALIGIGRQIQSHRADDSMSFLTQSVTKREGLIHNVSDQKGYDSVKGVNNNRKGNEGGDNEKNSRSCNGLNSRVSNPNTPGSISFDQTNWISNNQGYSIECNLHNAGGTPIQYGGINPIGTFNNISAGSYTVNCLVHIVGQQGVEGKCEGIPLVINPIAPVNGSCGVSSNSIFQTLTESYPNLCSQGTVAGFTFNSSTNKWTWTCQGQNGGTNANCSANMTPPVVCEGLTISNATVNGMTYTVNKGNHTIDCNYSSSQTYSIKKNPNGSWYVKSDGSNFNFPTKGESYTAVCQGNNQCQYTIKVAIPEQTPAPAPMPGASDM